MPGLEILVHALKITGIVFVMMVVIDWVDIRTRGRLHEWVSGRRLRQYITASFLGATPGCLGSFMNVSLYIHGFLSLGAIVGAMIATSGDESFVMFAEFPRIALLLHFLLFVMGIGFGFLTDYLAKIFNIQPCTECELQVYHPQENSVKHYFTVHIWNHLIKRHLIRIFLWTFAALWVVHLGTQYLQLESLVKEYPQLFLISAVLLGIIPESGPHLIFVMMFSQGMIPFSVLLASSMVQDGHGLLPLLSYTVRDSIIIKLFNAAYGLMVGLIVMGLGF